jgi:hypothetical protein
MSIPARELTALGTAGKNRAARTKFRPTNLLFSATASGIAITVTMKCLPYGVDKGKRQASQDGRVGEQGGVICKADKGDLGRVAAEVCKTEIKRTRHRDGEEGNKYDCKRQNK